MSRITLWPLHAKAELNFSLLAQKMEYKAKKNRKTQTRSVYLVGSEKILSIWNYLQLLSNEWKVFARMIEQKSFFKKTGKLKCDQYNF